MSAPDELVDQVARAMWIVHETADGRPRAACDSLEESNTRAGIGHWQDGAQDVIEMVQDYFGDRS